MRIGILGGTFNPVHNGHLHIARVALTRLVLDRVIFVPTSLPPHKGLQGNATAADRTAMLRLALKDRSRFGISRYEIRKGGTSYSVQTVRYFRKMLGRKTELFFIIGADSVEGLKKWKAVETLFTMVTFAVVTRPGHALSISDKRIVRLSARGKGISSTTVRALVRQGRPVHRLIPAEVRRYILRKGLYRGARIYA